jgi:hypothetical protein
MNVYQKIIFALKILFLLLFVLVKVGIIPGNTPFQTLVDSTFKLALGLYISYIAFPWRSEFNNIDKEDHMILFIAGIVSLLTIDYTDYIQAYSDFSNNVEDDEEEFESDDDE